MFYSFPSKINFFRIYTFLTILILSSCNSDDKTDPNAILSTDEVIELFKNNNSIKGTGHFSIDGENIPDLLYTIGVSNEYLFVSGVLNVDGTSTELLTLIKPLVTQSKTYTFQELNTWMVLQIQNTATKNKDIYDNSYPTPHSGTIKIQYTRSNIHIEVDYLATHFVDTYNQQTDSYYQTIEEVNSIPVKGVIDYPLYDIHFN
jgi:hypothetical protein